MTPNPESALNEAAGKMFLENYKGFCKHAQLLTRIHAGNIISDTDSNQENLGTLEQTKCALGKTPASQSSSVRLNISETRKKLRRL